MKPVNILCAVLSVFAVTSVYAVNAIPKIEREKAANAVANVLGAGVSPDSIRMTTLPGIYEARLPSGPVFVSKDASWVFQGNLIDVAKRENLTQKSISEMQQVNFSSIPLTNAIKFVKGNGSRKLITFEDPNCGYCKKFASELHKLDNVTVYVQPVAMIAPTSEEKVVNTLCSDNPASAWQALMITNKEVPACKTIKTKEAAQKKLQTIQLAAQKYFVNGTPTLFFEDNTRVNGFISVGDLETRLTQARKGKN